ncbi:uncharacterized protein PpBr36_09518 [Pyricularia pennisetigena]|uniref:uncharacterized protein n=1 Tax=Pyricularia pennisetigena TaxID=1578925 RepID=UPI00114F3105|nr:uncharacterized protein PpBr36_09518 [Pyricularia pennisetigena]TLS21943.1 hypothetical protein PpBr36_09518 [Pyricularia pennisetigena]
MASAAFPVLAALEIPQAATERPFPVHFRHPAYPDNAPPLLALCASNGLLDYDLALVCCCILAATNWNKGHLAVRQQEGLEKFPRPSDGLLRGREYFFCLEDVAVSVLHRILTEKYPFVHLFHNWRFPHGNLPLQWARLDIFEYQPPPLLTAPMAVTVRDGGCRISGYTDAVELAHLVPAKEKDWFVSNQMSKWFKYCRSTTSQQCVISDDQNMLLLHSDLRHLFDTRRIALVPKKVDIDTSQPSQLLVHVLEPSNSAQLVPLYHNRRLQHIQGLSKEFIFARFAWSLFTDERIPFVSWPGMFNIFVWNRITNQLETRVFTSRDVFSFSQVFGSSARSQSPSRSGSPKKRQRTEALGCDHSDYNSSDDEDLLSEDGCLGDLSFEQDGPRGRSLFRKSSK